MPSGGSAEVRGEQQVASSVTFCLIPLRQSCSKFGAPSCQTNRATVTWYWDDRLLQNQAFNVGARVSHTGSRNRATSNYVAVFFHLLAILNDLKPNSLLHHQWSAVFVCLSFEAFLLCISG